MPHKPELPIRTEGKIVISTKETFYHSRIKPRFSILVAIVAIIFLGLILSYENKLLALLTLVTSSFAIAVPLLDMCKRTDLRNEQRTGERRRGNACCSKEKAAEVMENCGMEQI